MVWAIFNQNQGSALEEIDNSAASDRVVAIVGGAILDESLKRALEQRFRTNTNVVDKTFKVSGPLGNLVPKIDIGYLLYMFEKDMRDALYGISTIRNEFAHNLIATFDSKSAKLNDAMGKLILHIGRDFYPNPFNRGQDSEYAIDSPKTQREVFMVNLKICLIRLLEDAGYHVPWTNIAIG